jgi:hypothetical protein
MNFTRREYIVHSKNIYDTYNIIIESVLLNKKGVSWLLGMESLTQISNTEDLFYEQNIKDISTVTLYLLFHVKM